MRYLRWALLAMLTYSAVAPLVGYATEDVPGTVVALVTNSLLVVGTLAVIAGTDVSVAPHLSDPRFPYAVLAGLFLTVGILAYYQALATGPVSVVVPVFGLFIVASSVLGVAFLEEAVTPRKAVGVAFAVVSVVLVAGE